MGKILLTDEELIHRIKEGSNRAFEIVFRKYYSELFCFACTFIMNKQQAEDLVQEVFVTVWSNRESLSGGVMLKRYLYSAVKNRCYDVFKHYKVEDRHKYKLTEALRCSGRIDDGFDDDLLVDLTNNLSALTQQQQIVIEMKYMEGQSYRQIASNMGVTENTVHTHVKRAYNTLRKLFFFF